MIEVLKANGTPVRNLQTMLREINFFYNILPEVIVDGIFDEITKKAVMGFQKRFNLNETGEVDIITFEKIVEEYKRAINNENIS
ncbi:MAG: peptidoglycan-binding protein [Ruminococcaceae bacterium]|nr:peptidoglycan-binding protein [Oscillospiraceae bacterium]